MAEKEVIVLCYWNGCIKYGPDGVYYEGATPKKISVKQKTEFSRFVEGLHIITGFDKQTWKLDIIGRYPVAVPPNLFTYEQLPVVDDSSLETMLKVPSIHPFISCVELYVEVKPVSDDVIDLAACSLSLDNPGSFLKRHITQQPGEADCYVDTDMTHPVVKVERDNGIEINADLGNGCIHGGVDLMNHNSSLDEMAMAVNLTADNANADKDLNASVLEVSANACLKKSVRSRASEPWSLSNFWVNVVPALFPPPINEKDKTKESSLSDKEEDMVEVEVDKEQEVEDGEEEKDDSEEEEDSYGEEEKVDSGVEEEKDGDGEGTFDGLQSTGAMDTEIETEPKQPLEMWFPNSEYRTPMSFGTRCYVWKAVEKLESILEPDELVWFHEHPQFRHFFHMPKDKTHKLMGMWMLLLRMAKTNKCKEAWFVVNGVPIRYSLREHALLSGLHCHKYPPDFEEFGSLEFVEKHFKTGKPSYNVLEKKFVSMKHSPDRLRMAVLYFISSVIIGKAHPETVVDQILMRAVTDIDWCKTFPWGRLSFDDTMREIFHMNHKLNRVINLFLRFPSFIIPLELLAFETIPVLIKRFRQKVIGASRDCPRMCRTKFKSNERGVALSEINDTLGSTKDIQSIVEITSDEASLMSRIMDDVSEESDCSDEIIDGWKKRLMVENKKIWFEELYNEDVDGRRGKKKVVARRKRIEDLYGWNEEEKAVVKRKHKEIVAKGKQKENDVGELKEIVEAGFKQLGEEMTNMKTMVNDKLGNFETRLKLVENYFPTHVSGTEESDTSPKASSSKRNKTEKPTKKHSKSASTKNTGEVRTKETPLSDQELRNAIADIFKAVNYRMASFTDIFKGLADKFGINLTPKSSIKLMIQDEVTMVLEANDKEAEE